MTPVGSLTGIFALTPPLSSVKTACQRDYCTHARELLSCAEDAFSGFGEEGKVAG
jgi:hypothetical protein